jgi:uncharacterized protein (UPF0335 family)
MGDRPWDSKEGQYGRPSSSVPALEPVRPADLFADPPERYRGVEAIEIADDEGINPVVEALTKAEAAAATAREVAVITAVESGAYKARKEGRIDGDSATALEQIAERAVMLMAQRDAVNQQIRDLFAFSKEIGFETKPLRKAINDLRQDVETRKAGEMAHETYRAALGIEGPEFVMLLPKAAAPVPPAAKRINAKEKSFRDSLALIAAGRIADAG